MWRSTFKTEPTIECDTDVYLKNAEIAGISINLGVWISFKFALNLKNRSKILNSKVSFKFKMNLNVLILFEFKFKTINLKSVR